MRLLPQNKIDELSSIMLRCLHWAENHKKKPKRMKKKEKSKLAYLLGYHMGKAYNCAWFLEKYGYVKFQPVFWAIPKKDLKRIYPGHVLLFAKRKPYELDNKKTWFLMRRKQFDRALNWTSNWERQYFKKPKTHIEIKKKCKIL